MHDELFQPIIALVRAFLVMAMVVVLAGCAAKDQGPRTTGAAASTGRPNAFVTVVSLDSADPVPEPPGLLEAPSQAQRMPATDPRSLLRPGNLAGALAAITRVYGPRAFLLVLDISPGQASFETTDGNRLRVGTVTSDGKLTTHLEPAGTSFLRVGFTLSQVGADTPATLARRAAREAGVPLASVYLLGAHPSAHGTGITWEIGTRRGIFTATGPAAPIVRVKLPNMATPTP
jgi:hypothetical protein